MSQEVSAEPVTSPTAQRRPVLERSLIASMAQDYGMDSGVFHSTIKATLMPQNTSNEAIGAFLVVAHKYRLNPFTREIFAFPDSKSGGIRPIVSIDGWAKLVNDHEAFDGVELADVFAEDGTFIAVEARFHRKDRKHPVVLREYLEECKRNTEPWKVWPRRMLRHKAYIQGARIAFGFSGIEDEDEYARTIEAQGVTVHHAPQTAKAVRTMDIAAAKPAEPRDPPGGAPMNGGDLTEADMAANDAKIAKGAS